MRLRNKLLRVFLLVALLFTSNSGVLAETDDYTIGENFSTGRGIGVPGSPCGPDDDCAMFSGNFKIRVGLFRFIEQNGQTFLVPYVKKEDGTKIKVVQFEPSNDGSTYSFDIDFDVYNKDAGQFYDFETNYGASYRNSAGNVLFDLNKQKIFNFSGMSYYEAGGFKDTLTTSEVKSLPGGYYPHSETSKTEYVTNLGLGSNFDNTFSGTETNRKNFVDYVMDLKEENSVPNSNEKINFVEFFLHASGFSKDWKLSDDEKQEFINNEFYLVVEPVYSYGVWHKGILYYAEGTARQLSYFALTALNANEYRDGNWVNWFWTPFWDLIAYNHVCNFVEKVNFSYLRDTSWAGKDFSLCDSIHNIGKASAYETYSQSIRQLQGNTPFGINVISLKRYKTQIEDSYTCTLSVSSCENNDFIFSSKLSYEQNNSSSSSVGTGQGPSGSGYVNIGSSNPSYNIEDLSKCILPLKTSSGGDNISEDTLSKYVYSTEASNPDDKLWCYDDVTYDFSQLKRNLEDKSFSTGQMIEIPSGKLTVNRTCYTKSRNLSNLNDSLKKLFLTDDTGKNYQSLFKFEFNNNTNYFFERNDNIIYDNPSCSSSNLSECYSIFQKKNRTGVVEYTAYTSKFYYYYDLNNGFNSDSLYVNNNDYSLSEYASTNSIQFTKKFGEQSVVIVPGKIQKNSENKIMPVSKKVGADKQTGLVNAFGLSSKFANLVNINARLNQENIRDGAIVTTSTLSSFKVLNSSTDNTCTFNTTSDEPENFELSDVFNRLKFRVISLSNPFPARDGTSRLPGSNWLNEDNNYVYEYIINNRNIQGNDTSKVINSEMIYLDKQPLYTITLDPSTMIKVRNYNKQKKGYSNIDLTCEEGTGRKCLSNFLRNTDIISSLSGTCSVYRQGSDVSLGAASNVLDESYYKSFCIQSSGKTINGASCVYDSKRDFDNNGFINSYDLTLLKKYIESGDVYLKNGSYFAKGKVVDNSNFYTCADKTASSGG